LAPRNDLAHLRFPHEESRGRVYPQADHPYRSAFQRDRDRIIHSRAFRRLADKTQVFGARYSDHFRSRLTHTLEVAQVARTVAATLGLDEDLAEALALVHDVGHPPYGHAGEKELDRQMRAYGSRFNHNLHALRLVDIFEHRYAAFPGLNLTFEVREGIVKHSLDFDAASHPELGMFLPGQKPPVEAQLIDLADEAAYNAADLDDAYAAGLVRLEVLAEEVPWVAETRDVIETSYPGASERDRFQEITRRMLDYCVSSLIAGTAEAAGGCRDVREVRESPERVARFTPDARAAIDSLRRFLHRYVYNCDALARERQRSSDLVAAVFQFLVQNSEQLPEGFRDERPPHVAVCDYLASMTDGFFERIAEGYGVSVQP
jgi:dGTPase